MNEDDGLVKVDGRTPFREAVRRALEDPVGEMVRHLDGVRNGDDIEALHDLRVATRRARAVLSVIEPAFPGKAFERFNKAIADLTDHLGAARDTDVFIEFLEAELSSEDAVPAYERIGIQAFRDHLKDVRSGQQETLLSDLAHLDPETLRQWSEAVFVTIHEPKSTTPDKAAV